MRSQPAIKLCLLRRGQRELIGFEAIPQLRNERKALRRSQPLKLVMRKQIHVLSIGNDAGKCKSSGFLPGMKLQRSLEIGYCNRPIAPLTSES